MHSKRGLTRWVPFLALASCIGVTLAYTAMMVTSTFSWYDDEGFMLFTLRQFESGTPLYDGMYTEYGPFYYLAVTGMLRLVGLPITHDVIRLLTIAGWTLLAAGSALCAWLWSRSALWSIATLFTATVILEPVRREPGHPQLLVQLLLLTAFATLLLQGKPRGRTGFFLIGCCIGGIFLTKVNIGIFMLLSLATLVVVPVSRSRLYALLRPVVMLLCLLLPAALMYRHLGEPAATTQWALFTFGIAALLYAVRRSTGDLSTAPLWAGPGFLLVFVSTVAASLLSGTSLSGLASGVLFQPMDFSRAIPFRQPATALLLAGTLACGWSAFVMIKAASLSMHFIARLRYPVASGLALITSINPAMGAFVAPALLWLFIPECIDDDRRTRSGSLVVIAATFGLLIAYPVNGTQLNLSTFMVFLAAIAAMALPNRTGFIAASGRYQWEHVLCSVLIFLSALNGAVDIGIVQLTPRMASGLPHSSLVRLPSERAATLRDINVQVSDRCNALVTIPGMNSFHLWSNVPRPTPYTVSAAMVLFDRQAQTELRHAFLAADRPCVIYHAELEEWTAQFRPSRTDQPFVDMVKSELVPVYSRSGYEVRVPRHHVMAWLP